MNDKTQRKYPALKGERARRFFLDSVLKQQRLPQQCRNIPENPSYKPLQRKTLMTDSSTVEDSEHKLNVRHLTINDYADIHRLMERVYPDLGGRGRKRNFVPS